MPLRAEPLSVFHFSSLRLQPAQSGDAARLRDPALQCDLVGPGSWAVVDELGITRAIGGLADLGAGRAYAWSFLGEAIGPDFIQLHRKVVGYFDNAPYHRIEMHVDVDQPAAIRWARLLGFEMEGTARRFFPDGRSAFHMART